MIGFWDLYATVYDSLPKHFSPYKFLLDEVVEEVSKYCVKGKLLDAGCGTGNYTIALAKLGYDVIGIDSAAGMLRRAVSKKKKDGIGNITLIRSDLEQRLAFQDNYFDVLICINALYSMKNPGNIINEFYRVLRPDGYFILCEPQRPVKLAPIIREARDRGGLKETVNVLFHLFLIGCFNLALGKKQSEGVYHYWNEREMKEILAKTNFKVMSLKRTYTNKTDILISSIKLPSPEKRPVSVDYTTDAAIISSR